MTNFPALTEAQGKLDHARNELASVLNESKNETGAYDMDRIKSVAGDRAAKLAWIQAKNAELAPLKAEVDSLKAVMAASENVGDITGVKRELSGAENGGDQRDDRKQQSLGEMFIKSAAYKNKGAKATLDVDLKTAGALFERGAGWQPEVTRSGLVTLMPMVPAPSVTDHLVTIPVAQSGYKYMEETTYTNNASEADEGSTYGEAGLALTERSQTVEKVAVWIPITDEQLEDEPGARAYVESRLQNMLRQRLDQQVLQGTGTNSGTVTQLLGTINKSGIQSQALGSDTLLDASYKLFTTIRTDGFAEPSVCFLQASDWQQVMLQKTADGLYIYSNPASGAPNVLWGVPVVQTQAAVSGTMVTGDYANYAFLGVKRGIDMQVTNSHDTFFINGKQAIRVDTRVVMVHIRPKAFGKLTGI